MQQHCLCMIQLEAGGSSGNMPFYNSLFGGFLLLLEKNMSRFEIAAANLKYTGISCGFLPTSAFVASPLLPPLLMHQLQLILQHLIARIIHISFKTVLPTRNITKYCRFTCQSIGQ
jgi:hypothetical protein